VLEVDGAYGEGGGQILRTSVALSAITGRPCRIVNIRAGRPNPGLAAQHVAAVHAVAALSNAHVAGAEVGSSDLSFEPGTIAPGRHTFDVGTAGSVALVLQACLPVAFAARAPVHLKLIGGTDVRWSPPLDYVARIFLPLLRRLGGDADVVLLRRGYYPRGGGAIEVAARPAKRWSAFSPEEVGPVERIRGIAHVSNLSADIPKRMKHAAMRRLQGRGDVEIEERVYTADEATGRGGAIVLRAETERTILGADALAERGKPSERVGEEAAAALAAELDAGATLDAHAADQVLLYMAQADEASRFVVRAASGHLRTMAWLLPQFLERRIEVEPCGARWRVTVGGSVE